MKNLAFFVLLIIAFSCKKDIPTPEPNPKPPVETRDDISQFDARQWDGTKRGGVFYEIFVRSFADSNGDGIGDLKGITNKLDYLNQLGIAGIWLTPIHPSPSYHGYDVDNYMSVKSEYGTIQDFEEMIAKANSLGIKVVLDLVLNHTSKNHPWFIDAISTVTSSFRNFYLFAPSNSVDSYINSGKVPMTDIYYSGQWHNVPTGTTEFKYMGMFSDWMPDINYGNVDTCEKSAPFRELINVSKFWISKGVAGFRLDAVKHIYQNETSDENPHFLKKFYDELKSQKSDLYMIGENLSGNYKDVSPYYKGLPALFNFDAWYKLIYAIENSHAKWYPKDIIDMESSFKTQRSDAINATKLSNHDEDRTLSRLGGNPDRAKIAAAILLTVSGSPYLYYGEEIGMLGMKTGGDENVREPFLWDQVSSDNFRTTWRKPSYSTDIAVKPLEQQKRDLTSVYRVYEKFIKLRNTYPSLAYGSMSVPSNFETYDKNFMVFFREYQGEKLMIIHNVSPSTASYATSEPISKPIADMGKVSYSKINSTSYSVTMPPYSTIIFEL
ncbi:MAG: alpha-amylase family glycosyl hydrolase [Bacteroidales bacterium]|jgi:glycosidase|nr:alpha-amylase family glycosyl hydrolase [Bacteroidales bacterium]